MIAIKPAKAKTEQKSATELSLLDRPTTYMRFIERMRRTDGRTNSRGTRGVPVSR